MDATWAAMGLRFRFDGHSSSVADLTLLPGERVLSARSPRFCAIGKWEHVVCAGRDADTFDGSVKAIARSPTATSRRLLVLQRRGWAFGLPPALWNGTNLVRA